MLAGQAQGGGLADHIVGFGRALRRAGVPTDSSLISLALRAADVVGVERRCDLRDALRAVMVSRQADLAVFDELFEAWFVEPQPTRPALADLLPQAQQARPIEGLARAREALSPPQLVQPLTAAESVLDAAMTASELTRLRHADFASLSASEYRRVLRLAGDIRLNLPCVAARRTVVGGRGAFVHWPQAIRQARRHEGELLQLPRRQRREQPLPLLILVDVSGSMERYARLMLAFLHRATSGRRRSVFAFGCGLTDLSQAFRQSDPDVMLARSARAIVDYAGGTRIGESLASLRREHGRCLVGRRTVVLLISDGLDTGPPAALAAELDWLSRRSRSLLWLNPLLRYEGYAPLARGAEVLSRYAQATLAIHNLSRLESLAQSLARLVGQR